MIKKLIYSCGFCTKHKNNQNNIGLKEVIFQIICHMQPNRASEE